MVLEMPTNCVLGTDLVLQRVREENLLEGLSDRELRNPEGCGLDLRLGKAFRVIEGGAFIEVDGEGGLGLRRGVKTQEVASFIEASAEQQSLSIGPGEYYLVQTIERINTPQDLMPVVFPRTSLFRAGLLLLVSKTDPGYRGSLTFGLRNLSHFDVRLQMGARICNIVSFTVQGQTSGYRGQHMDGRISPEETERQV